MAISVLDARDSLGVAPARAALHLLRAATEIPAGQVEAAPETVERRRLPLVVLGAALAAALEAVGLLAAGLTGLEGVLTSAARPTGFAVSLGLGVLATWIVLCAGGGAAMLDGLGRRLYRGVCVAEYAVIGGVLLLSVTGVVDGGDVPLTAFALLALSAPTIKLLLAGAPAAAAWVAQGPRPREQRPDPVYRHRALCVATLAVIGLALAAVTFVAPASHGAAPLSAGVAASR